MRISPLQPPSCRPHSADVRSHLPPASFPNCLLARLAVAAGGRTGSCSCYWRLVCKLNSAVYTKLFVRSGRHRPVAGSANRPPGGISADQRTHDHACIMSAHAFAAGSQAEASTGALSGLGAERVLVAAYVVAAVCVYTTLIASAETRSSATGLGFGDASPCAYHVGTCLDGLFQR